MILSREAIQRMITDEIGGGGGGAGISGSALANLLTGYATQDWVGENYISIEFFSRLFQAHGTENGQQTNIDPNDMDSTITSIESMFGFWTDYYLSALGNGGGLGSTLYLASLADIALSNPSDNQVLTYNATMGKWVNANAQAGVTDLASLTDVVLTTPSANQVLIYNGTSWVNTTLKTVNGYILIGSGDIPASCGSTGNYLPLAGGTMTGGITFINVLSRSIRHLYSGKEAVEIGLGGYGQGIFQIYDNGDELIRFFAAQGYPSFIKTFLSIETGDNHSLNQNMLSSASFCIGEYDDDAMWMGRTPQSYGWIQCSYKAASSAQYALLLNPLGGNVVIGNTSPSNYLLDVNGSLSFKGGRSTGAIVFPNVTGRSVRCTYNNLDIVEFGDGGTGNGIVQVYDNGNEKIRLYSAGNSWINYGDFGIGTSSPSYRLHVAGDIYATGAVTALSDARKKDVQKGVAIGVEQIADAPAVQFLWKGERAKEGVQVGTLAQYWQGVLPEVVMNKGGELSMQYGVAALVSSIITARKVVDHERRISELEKENERLKTEVKQLRLN